MLFPIRIYFPKRDCRNCFWQHRQSSYLPFYTDQNVLPQLNQTLDLFSSATGELTVTKWCSRHGRSKWMEFVTTEKSLKKYKRSTGRHKNRSCRRVQGHIGIPSRQISMHWQVLMFFRHCSIRRGSMTSVALHTFPQRFTERLYPVKIWFFHDTVLHEPRYLGRRIVLIAIFKMEVDKDHLCAIMVLFSLYWRYFQGCNWYVVQELSLPAHCFPSSTMY